MISCGSFEKIPHEHIVCSVACFVRPRSFTCWLLNKCPEANKQASLGEGRLSKHVSNGVEYIKNLEEIKICVYEQNCNKSVINYLCS